MGSEDDTKGRESGQPRSEFGPPMGDFGQPVSEFGPPVGEFGPPMGDFGPPVDDFGPPTSGQPPQWSEPATDHPELIWRPADEPPAMPPPPAQYRAPDTTVFPDAPPPVPPDQRAPQPPVDADEDLTTPGPPAAPPGVERDTWWNQPADGGGVPTPPPASEPGLSWSDDPIAKRLAPSAIPTPVFTTNRQKKGSRGRWIALGSVAAAAVVGALVATIIAVNRDSGGGSAAPPPVTPTAALSCPASKDGKVTVGNGAGDTNSGAGAILGFQYAYYVERSGERARSYLAPDAEYLSPAEILQKAINEEIPVGTTHCVRIAETAPDTYDVDLTEHRANGTTIVYPQTVSTVDRDGKKLIFAVRER
ncbi:hypothetical protein [Nocardia sp. NBC_01009]|uniref:hypothetical protein n=1 Tax=Nocardia sp. NBC_01009 TaxID=2975996 RepID=UPI00386FF879|nr:hypothetical protein OHA42_10700 [Nocardia sp. NBC_01009]